ncbi:alpha/beta hydrolase family protein [Pseudomonas sp. 5P_3.1_Bac2]|uniref:alpha/beta hydrolase family protein n=1 Tax=Pseudomonas sp. 5P_3.1_Bac2 TaxID=2971617 RepID=UPI0021C64DBD|nr:S9 family peptidase [Pseudomonas sp. 5P_3.1_Bac2]MCU1717397.1 S9 family peptidase [Pseudomonas sp. 5P_3.1_Bac2]
MPAQPYGHWPSDWSSLAAAAAGRDFAELRAGLGGLVWSEFDPADGRTRLWRWTPQQRQCLSPDLVSVRSRVYEYGGGAFCLSDLGLAWVNEADQQVYWQVLGGEPQPISRLLHCRYGDLNYDRLLHAVLAVEEEHGDQAVVHRLVSLSCAGEPRQVVAQGADFYSAPTLSGDGQRLAWIEWDRPYQPWLATRLCVAQRLSDGTWSAPQTVAGQAMDQALQQPLFDPQQRLLVMSDVHGFWQPWRETQAGSGLLQPLPAKPCDHAGAPWQMGARSYQVFAQGMLLSGFNSGYGWLLDSHELAGGQRRLASEYSRFRQLAMDEQYFYVIAASPLRPSNILAIERSSGALRVLASTPCALPATEVSPPEPLNYPTADGQLCHGFFYPPHNSRCSAQPLQRPPLLVFLHGGPTSACYPAFDPRIQFWTQRGFAVADLNYRGSSGFGRAYRLSLHGTWGEAEVADAEALVDHLAARDLIDPQRAFIRGASAGGYTALCALAFSRVFRAGASLYGVSDPLRLRATTHKFEADYLDWLIGDPLQHPQRYAARTPLRHAAAIRAPVIFFQGGLDAVVLPEQTAQMVSALQQQGVEVESITYAEERHGFRQAENLADALDRELAFYQRYL